MAVEKRTAVSGSGDLKPASLGDYLLLRGIDMNGKRVEYPEAQRRAAEERMTRTPKRY